MAAGDFTLRELNELSVGDLHKIMVFMNLPYTTKLKRSDMVQVIWANMPKEAAGETVFPDDAPRKMSVRVERIYKSLGRLP